jgi:hypothetical protein
VLDPRTASSTDRTDGPDGGGHLGLWLALGVVLGLVGGVLAGLLRAPQHAPEGAQGADGRGAGA